MSNAGIRRTARGEAARNGDPPNGSETGERSPTENEKDPSNASRRRSLSGNTAPRSPRWNGRRSWSTRGCTSRGLALRRYGARRRAGWITTGTTTTAVTT